MMPRHLIVSIALAAAVGVAPAGGDPARPETSARLSASASQPLAYRDGVIEVRLRPSAARTMLPRGASPTGAGRRDRLGVAGVDGAAAALGATFEAEFAGEIPPAESDAEAIDFTAFQRVHLPPGVSLDQALARFRSLPDVLSAEAIPVLHVSRVPNDSLWSISSWFLDASPPRHDVRAPEAWDVTTGDSTVVVGVLDTGVLAYHPELGGTIAGARGNLYVNRAEAGGLPGVDDDANGFVDDVSGWDFVNLASGSGIPLAEDWRDPDNDPNDFAGHGTMVAGVVGALADNGAGVTGTAWRVRIMPLRMGWSANAAPEGLVDMSYAAAAIRYATRMGAHVLNCSFDTADLSGLGAAVTAAVRAGVVIVSAAGNLSPFHYLGDRDDGVAVAACDSDDVIASFSNLGPYVDVTAPGVLITSTALVHLGADSLSRRTPAYGVLSGTSFSSPIVAGAVALMQQHRVALGLDPYTPTGASLRLRETADDISAENPSLTDYGGGRLNLYRALVDPPRSTVTRTRARALGPALALRSLAGGTRLVYAMSDRHLLFLDSGPGDTLALVTLPAVPAGSLAAADMGGERGVELFVGGNDGRVHGYSAAGVRLAGWPAGPGGIDAMSAGVALGDLDGDGVLEVVAGSSVGLVYAWHADGTLLANYPIDIGPGAPSAPALADLDADGALEQVWTGADGRVHVLDASGGERPGWPIALAAGTRAPVVGRLGGPASPVAILAASPAQLSALSPDGTPRWTVALAGTPSQDPVLADVNGDGADEVLVALATPASLDLRDSTGAPVAGSGYPVGLGAAVAGPPIVASLRPAHAPAFVYYQAGGIVARDLAGAPLAGYPRTGLAGVFPIAGDFDDDGATELAVGTGPDSALYLYDAGPATWSAGAAPWPTPRGNEARTGSRLSPGAPLVVDDIRPAPVADLALAAVSTTAVQARWTRSGDDSLSGRAHRVEMRYASAPLTAANFTGGTLVPLGAPGDPGAADSASVTGLAEGGTYWFAIRYVDEAGNPGALSNLPSVQTSTDPPSSVADLRVIATSDSSVTLAWTAPGGDGASGRPASYTIAAADAPVDGSNFLYAPTLVTIAAAVDAGGTEAAAVALAAGRRWWFALRATDASGFTSPLSNGVSAITPRGGALAGRVGVALAAQARPSRVPVLIDWQGAAEGPGARQTLALFDVSGRLVRTFELGSDPGGTQTWDGRDDEGSSVPAGLYFARLVSGSFHAGARIVLIP